ncbi:mucin-3B-like [Saccostrea cucullata]|uniref:mucin-3B-like n=1 Tax=Saccostrea cuccullata TaxID=36930 RepID=UPI002ED33334
MGRCSWTIPVIIVLFLSCCRCLEELLESSLPFLILNDTRQTSGSTPSIKETLSPYKEPYKVPLSPTLSLTSEIIYDKGRTTLIPHIIESNPTELTKDISSKYKDLISPTLSIISTYDKDAINSSTILQKQDSSVGLWTTYAPIYKEQITHATRKILESTDEISEVNLKLISKRIVDTTPSLESTDIQSQYREQVSPTISATSEITEQTISKLVPQNSIAFQKLQTADKLSRYAYLKSNTISTTTQTIYGEYLLKLISTEQNHMTPPDKSSSGFPTSKFQHSETETKTKITAEAWMVNMHNASPQPLKTESLTLPILTSSIMKEDTSEQVHSLELSLWSLNFSSISSVYEIISENTKTTASSSVFLMTQNPSSSIPSPSSLIQTSPTSSKKMIHNEAQTVNLLSELYSDSELSHETLISITTSTSHNFISPSRTQVMETEFSPGVTEHASSILMSNVPYDIQSQSYDEVQEIKDDPKTSKEKTLTTPKDEKAVLTSSIITQKQFDFDTSSLNSVSHVIEPSFDMNSEILSDFTSASEAKASYFGILKKEKLVDFTEQKKSKSPVVTSEYLETSESISFKPSIETNFLERNSSVFSIPKTNFTENIDNIKVSLVTKSLKTNQSNHNSFQEKRSSSKVFMTDLPYYTYENDLNSSNPFKSYRSSTTPYSTGLPKFSSIERSFKYESYPISIHPSKEKFTLPRTTFYYGLKPYSQEHSKMKEIQDRIEAQSQTKTSARKIRKFAYTQTTHGLSGSEAENIDVHDFISIPSLKYTDSDHQIASTFNTDSVYEHENDSLKLSMDLHTTYIEENNATISSNQLLNDSNSIATGSDQESIEAIVPSSEPTFEIFHSLSDKLVLQEIASTSQHETSYLSLFPSQDSSSQPELQSSYTLVQGGSTFWTTNTEPLSTVNDKIDRALIPSTSQTRVKALAAVSKQTQNQIKSFISHAFSSLTNQTQTVRSAQSGIHTAWFESNVSFDNFNTSQHKSLDSDKENQSKSEYHTFLSNQNVGTSNFFTSTQFRLEDAISSLIRPTPSTAYDVNTTQPPKFNSNNVVVQVETNDKSNNKILTYKTPTPSSASNSMDYVSTVFSTILMQGDRKTLTSDNEKKNVVQTSESSGILYSSMENQYEYSSMSQTEISIALTILSVSSNVGIFDSSLSSTEIVQMPNNLDTSYSSPMLNDVQSTFIDHWSVFQTPTSHISKEMVSKQTLQDTSTSNSSKGGLEFPTTLQSSIFRLETTTSNSALISDMFQISSDVHYITEDFQNLTMAKASMAKENLINMDSSSILENSAVDSESPRPSLHSSFTHRLSTSMGEQFYSSSRTRQSLHDSNIIVTSAIDIDKHIFEINSFVRSQFTSESDSHINSASIAESSQIFTMTNVSVFHETYEHNISSNRIDSSLSKHTTFSSLIDENDVADVKYFTTSSNYNPAISQLIVSSLLSSLEFETTFTPGHVYFPLTLSRTRKFNEETTLHSLDMFSSETEKLSSTVLPVTSIIEQELRSITSSGYNYSATNSAEVKQERGISRVDILPLSVSVAFSGSINEFDTTGSAFSTERHSPTVQFTTITSSEKTESETHDVESNANYSKEKEKILSTSLAIKPSLSVLDTSSSSIMVSLFAETNLLVLEINVKPEIDISNDDFKSNLEEDLTTVYIEGLHGRRKRNSIRHSTRQVQDTGISVKVREIDRKFGERVKIIFLVMYNGIVVHASLAELTFQKVSDVEMSAILGYPVIVSVSRWNAGSTSPPNPGGWEEIFQPLVIVLITLPTSIVIIATIIAIVRQCRSKSIHKHPSIPSQMDSLYKHNLVVDVENGDVRNRRISYEYPSDDEFSMASSDVFNEIKSKYSQSMHSKIKNFEKHNLKNHFHNHVERKASDALTNKVKFSVSAEDSKCVCVKTDSNESNDSGVSSDGQKSPGEGPDVPCLIPERVSQITSANVPQNLKQQNNLQIPPRNISLQNPYPVKKKTNIKNLNSERVTSWVFMGDNTDAPNNRVHHEISGVSKTNENILENDSVTQVTHDFNHIPSMCDNECQTSDQPSDSGVQDHIYETLNRNDSVKEEKTEQSSMTQTESGTSGSDGFEYLEPLRQLLMAVENHRRRNPPVSQFLQEENVLQRCIHGFCNMGNCHANCSPVSVPSRYGEEIGECAKKCNCETPISAKQAQETRAGADHVCNERQLVTEQLNPSKELLRRPVVLSDTKEACIYDQPEFSLVGFTNSAEI